MRVQIKETNEIKELSITGINGVNYVRDFIGNYGAFADQFLLNEENGTFIATQEDYDWWVKVLADQQALSERIADLKEVHGADAVDEIVNEASGGDLEDEARNVNYALDEAFGE